MCKKRLFQVLVVIAFAIVTALTLREAFAGSNNVSQKNATKGTKILTCASLPSRYSLHTEIVNETGMTLPYTEDGPTGIDGGLVELLTSYRTCSR